MFERKKIGVALGSGGMKGLAHIGVLKVLEEHKIPVDFISGTSIGAVIGALYAAEPNAKKLEKIALDQKLNSLFDYTLSRYGLIKGEKIEKYLKEKLDNVSFKELKIPLFVTAFDLEEKREIIFSKGDVAKAVRASIAIPGIFFPVANNKEMLVDGGVIDPIPIKILRKMGADIVIAVNVNKMQERPPVLNEVATTKAGKKKIPSILENALTSIGMMGSESSRADLDANKADLAINVNLEKINMFEFKKTKFIIEKGRMAAAKSLNDIKNIAEPSPFKFFLQELNPKKNVEKIVRSVKKTIAKAKELD
ncbi:patatin-like phospholipase family protein [Candidatus Pacearchaeota archaeon]|nr:patatin-like phospholipase family protein [Candidatus Pacearchaeota archaeon]